MVFWTRGPEKPAAPRVLEEYSSGLGIGAALEEAWVGNPLIGAIYSAQRDVAERGAPIPQLDLVGPPGAQQPREAPDSEIMSAQEANHWFGIPGELTFDSDTPARAAQLRYDWKRDELRRRDILDRASQTTGAALARMGASFVAQAADPLNIAMSFIPVVGEARYARLLQLAGSSAFRRAAVRGAVGAIEGAAGAALVEPLVYAGYQARGQQYDLWDSLANVGYGAALGGGLHSIGGAGFDAVRSYTARRRAGKLTDGEMLVENIGRPTHEAMTQGAINQLQDGRRVAVAEGLDVVEPAAKYPVYRADESDISGSIERFADQVTGKQDHSYLQIGEVAPSTIAAAKEIGFDLTGYHHVMQGDDIRHALERHGPGSAVPANEVPVTAAELAKVPEIIANPDRVIAVRTKDGHAAIQFNKRMGNTHIVVEEVRGRKKRLAFKTMVIRRAGGAGDGGIKGGSGGPDLSDGSLLPGDLQTIRPNREPGTAAASVGDTVREINAPDEIEAQAIARIEAETAKSLEAPEDIQAEIQHHSELLAEETALLGDELDARDRAVLEEGKAIDSQAAEEGKAYDAASICMVKNGS